MAARHRSGRVVALFTGAEEGSVSHQPGQIAKPVSERHAEAPRRVAQADDRILAQEKRVRLLKAGGHPTAESERLLTLMRTSRSLIQEEAELLTTDKAWLVKP